MDWMLTADLVFSSRAAAAAQAEGRTLGIAASTEQLLESAASQPAQLVILDLTTPGCDTARIVRQMHQQQPPAHIVAYAPHVMTAALQQARQAGCDQVLTRGQFDKRLNQLLQSV